MAGFRPMGIRNGLVASGGIQAGDVMLAGESLSAGALATVGDGVWTGALMVNGLIQRTGPVGAYADITDTSTNIMLALAGNSYAADVAPGSTWRLLVRNTVAQANTVSLGVGVRNIAGVSPNIAASLVRCYILTVLNASPQATLTCVTTNGSPTVAFVFPSGTSSWMIGPSPLANNLTAGMTISGTGITAGTRIKSVTQGPGGITGVVMDGNATADSTGVSLTFMPTIGLDSIFSTTL